MRVDPNTQLRFFLRSGEVTRWVRGKELWRSDVGISFDDHHGVFFIGWQEILGAEVRNLSGGKTAAAIIISATVVALVVAAILGKGGGGGGGSLGSFGAVGSAKRSYRHRRAVRPLRPHGAGGVHIHLPIMIAASHHAHASPSSNEAPRPQSGPMPAAGKLPDEVPTGMESSEAGATQTAASYEATRLFEGAIRRRSGIQLVGSVAAGTEMINFRGYTGTLSVGMRIRNAFELAGGVRHLVASERYRDHGNLRSSFIGFGRIGAHLFLDNNHIVAMALSSDIGAGQHTRFHLKLNVGLRIHPTSRLMIGVFPFNPMFNAYKASSPFGSMTRWTFPTTLEVGFNF